MTTIDVMNVDQRARYSGCRHGYVSYGPCHNKGDKEYAHSKRECLRCKDPGSSKFHSGCRYRTHLEDYNISDRNTLTETIFIDDSRLDQYQNWYKSSGKLMMLVIMVTSGNTLTTLKRMD